MKDKKIMGILITEFEGGGGGGTKASSKQFKIKHDIYLYKTNVSCTFHRPLRFNDNLNI